MARPAKTGGTKSKGPSPRRPTPRNLARRKGRSAARLAAVQALYQVEVGDIRPEVAILDFINNRVDEDLDGISLAGLDKALFAELVRNVHGEREQLDDMLSAVLAEDWPVERLDSVLRLILRAGAYELASRPETPTRTAISEYVDLAHAFFGGKEPGMANGVLDRLARSLRLEDFEDTEPDGLSGDGPDTTADTPPDAAPDTGPDSATDTGPDTGPNTNGS